MSLRTIFERLYAEALARGEASAELEGGAAVRVRASGCRRQVVLSRAAAPVGVVELLTFQACGEIPSDAVGVCWLPARGVYRVSYTWEEPPAAPLLDLLDAAPAPGAHVYQLLAEGEPLPAHLGACHGRGS